LKFPKKTGTNNDIGPIIESIDDKSILLTPNESNFGTKEELIASNLYYIFKNF